jgi:hypothetical protein
MRFHRKTAPGVRDGRVTRKNRWRREPDYTRTHQVRIERVKAPPGFRHYVSPTDVTAFLGLLPDWHELAIGLQRVVLSADTSCLGWHTPGTVAVCAWEDVCPRVLYPPFHAEHADILHRLRVPCRRIVMVDARLPPEDPPTPPPADEHCVACDQPVYLGDRWYRLLGENRLLCEECGYDPVDLPADAREDGPGAPGYLAEFTPATVQAFLLLHVLLHELGHHHDRMTSPGRRDISRGERYAEEYARRYEPRIWSAYCRVFRFGLT